MAGRYVALNKKHGFLLRQHTPRPPIKTAGVPANLREYRHGTLGKHLSSYISTYTPFFSILRHRFGGLSRRPAPAAAAAGVLLFFGGSGQPLGVNARRTLGVHQSRPCQRRLSPLNPLTPRILDPPARFLPPDSRFFRSVTAAEIVPPRRPAGKNRDG